MKSKMSVILLSVILVIVLGGCGSSGNKANTSSAANTSAANTSAANTSAANTSAAASSNAPAAGQQSDLAGQTITVYSPQVDDDAWVKLVQAFETKTGVTVKSVKAPSDVPSNEQKLTVSLSSGDSEYDVFYIDELTATGFESAGFLAPFDDATFPADVRKDYDPNELNIFSLKNGKYYTLPNEISAMLLFVNKKLFDAAGVAIPTNADEFMDAAKKLTKPDGSQYGLGLSWCTGGCLVNDAIRWSYAFGGDYTNWNNPNTQKAFQTMHDFVYKDKITPIADLGYNGPIQAQNFVDGHLAMMYSYNSFAAKMGDEFGKSMIVIPNIKFTTDKTIGGSWFYAINKNSEHMEAANAFIKWLATTEGQNMVVKLPNHSSGNSSVLKNSGYLTNVKLFEYMNAGSILPRPITSKNVTEIQNETTTVLSQYLTNQITLEQAVSAGQKILDKLNN